MRRPLHLGTFDGKRQFVFFNKICIRNVKPEGENSLSSTGKPVAEIKSMTCTERLKQDILKSSQKRQTVVHPTTDEGELFKMCIGIIEFFCRTNDRFVTETYSARCQLIWQASPVPSMPGVLHHDRVRIMHLFSSFA